MVDFQRGHVNRLVGEGLDDHRSSIGTWEVRLSRVDGLAKCLGGAVLFGLGITYLCRERFLDKATGLVTAAVGFKILNQGVRDFREASEIKVN